GGCARMLGKLAEAERALATALALAVELEDERLQVANRLRLAHVYHWQRNFERADRLLADLIELCKREPELAVYLDFAYQHAGKCKFDQEQYTAAQRFFTRALAIRQQKGDLDLIASTQHALDTTRRRMAAGEGR